METEDLFGSTFAEKVDFVDFIAIDSKTQLGIDAPLCAKKYLQFLNNPASRLSFKLISTVEERLTKFLTLQEESKEKLAPTVDIEVAWYLLHTSFFPLSDVGNHTLLDP